MKMSKKNHIRSWFWGLLNPAFLQALFWVGVLSGLGASAQASCNFLLDQRVLLGFEKSVYRTHLLAKTVNDEPYFAIGSITDSHDDLQFAIEGNYGEVNKIFLAGEAAGMPVTGVQLTNETGGINKRKPQLAESASIEHLKAAIKHNPILRSIFPEDAIFRTYSQNPEHLHPALDLLASFRHEFNNYMGPIVLNFYFQDMAVLANDVGELKMVNLELSEQAKKLRTMMFALQQLNVPEEGHLYEIYEFDRMLGRLVDRQQFSSDEKKYFIDLSKKMGKRNPSPILTIIPLNRWY